MAISQYNVYMAGVDRFDQLIKYYSFLRRTVKWSKKMTLVQMAMQNAFALYTKYSTDAKKMSHLQFQMLAIEALIFFDLDEWPVQGPPIRRPGVVVGTPGSPGTSATGTATPPPVPARPSAAPQAQSEEDVDDPDAPVEVAKQRRPRYSRPA